MSLGGLKPTLGSVAGKKIIISIDWDEIWNTCLANLISTNEVERDGTLKCRRNVAISFRKKREESSFDVVEAMWEKSLNDKRMENSALEGKAEYFFNYVSILITIPTFFLISWVILIKKKRQRVRFLFINRLFCCKKLETESV